MPENHTNKNTQPPKKKRFTWWKITLIILALMPTLVLLKLILILTAVPTISVDYAGQINLLSKPPNYDPNQNAAPYYQNASHAYLAEMPLFIGLWRDLCPADMNDSQVAVLGDWLAVNTQALALLEKAVSKPYCWIKLHSQFRGFSRFGNTIDQLNPFSVPLNPISFQLAYLLYFRIKFDIRQGQPDLAFQHAASLYRMGVQLSRPNPFGLQTWGTSFKSMAVTSFFAILHIQQIEPRKLELFHEQIDHEISHGKRELDFRCEKIILYDLIQSIYTDNGRGNGHLIPRQAYVLIQPVILTTISPTMDMAQQWERDSFVHLIWEAITGPDRKQTANEVDEYFAYLDSIKNLTPWQLRNHGIDPEKRFEDLLKNSCVKEAIRFRRGHRELEPYHRLQAEEAALLATVAVLRYKADKGQLPKSLQQLISAGYLKELPMDPYSDGPLVYKRTGDDFILYSVGADFDDDGGVRSDWGKWESGDQVFWPVERQNLQKE